MNGNMNIFDVKTLRREVHVKNKRLFQHQKEDSIKIFIKPIITLLIQQKLRLFKT